MERRQCVSGEAPQGAYEGNGSEGGTTESLGLEQTAGRKIAAAAETQADYLNHINIIIVEPGKCGAVRLDNTRPPNSLPAPLVCGFPRLRQ